MEWEEEKKIEKLYFDRQTACFGLGNKKWLRDEQKKVEWFFYHTELKASDHWPETNAREKKI